MEGVQFKWKDKSFTLLHGEQFLVELSFSDAGKDTLRVITVRGNERRRETVPASDHRLERTFGPGIIDSKLAKISMQYKAASRGLSFASAFPIIPTAPAPNARCFTASMGKELKADDAYLSKIAKASPYFYQGPAA